jgi:hypothetical protein
MSKHRPDPSFTEQVAAVRPFAAWFRSRRGATVAAVLVALAAAVAVAVGGTAGPTRGLDRDAPGTSSRPASTVPTSAATAGAGSLGVSGTGVGGLPFGTDAEKTLTAVTDRVGEPDLDLGPQRYSRIPGGDSWFEDADDPLSPSWRYPVTSVTCWGTLCLIFGGDDADALRLRGWELARYRRWSGSEERADPLPDVRLADTGIRLGDTWERLHAAYPGTVIAGAEGASVSVRNTPWAVVSDGAAGWRLSGSWDYRHPNRAPAGAVVTRLSGGQGPEPGCC